MDWAGTSNGRLIKERGTGMQASVRNQVIRTGGKVCGHLQRNAQDRGKGELVTGHGGRASKINRVEAEIKTGSS